jgi:hypothetical protein
MFCPNCEAEYRSGFNRCSDCDVALVERLEDTDVPSNNPEISGTPELLWTGMDARIRDGIIDALEAANIPHHERGDKVGSLPGWSKHVYAVFIHARDHSAATAALEEATRRSDTEPEDSEEAPRHSNAPLQDSSANDEDDDMSDLPSDYVPEDFDPDEATAEVWSGQDATTRDNLITCLRGIGIGSATDEFAGQLRIRVTPSSEKRAKEMIRQIADASSSQ